MKSNKNLYPKLCSYKNLVRSFEKAKKGKSFMPYVVEFKNNLTSNLLKLKKELENFTYKPAPLTKVIIRDPKTRVIHISAFRDRVIHHALVNIIEPIFEKIFIYDSYASRKNKGPLKAVQRFDYFKRKVSKNGKPLKNSIDNNQIIGYCLKADIKHYFEEVDHNVLFKIIKMKIQDEKVIRLIEKILKNRSLEWEGGINNFESKGMPLGNLTSQFFANVYLNELDYFIKHKLKAKYYIRYVDDFVILHENKNALETYKEKITRYLKNLRLELHQDKSKIFSLYRGVDLLDFRCFYHYKLLRKRNIKQFYKRLEDFKKMYENELLEYDQIMSSILGWFAYAIWANTYILRKDIVKRINVMFSEELTNNGF